MSELSDKDKKLAAMTLSALMTTPDDALEDFRKRRLSRTSTLDLNELRRMRTLLVTLAEALRKDDEELWRRVAAAHDALVGPAPQVVGPAAQLVAPAAQLVAPAAQLLAPAPQLVAPAPQLVAPAAQLLGPAAQLLGPATQLLDPAPAPPPRFDLAVPPPPLLHGPASATPPLGERYAAPPPVAAAVAPSVPTAPRYALPAPAPPPRTAVATPRMQRTTPTVAVAVPSPQALFPSSAVSASHATAPEPHGTEADGSAPEPRGPEAADSALPFRRSVPSERSSAAASDMPVAAYAAILALGARAPTVAAAIYARFGVTDDAARAESERSWRARFEVDPGLYELLFAVYAKLDGCLALHAEELAEAGNRRPVGAPVT